MYQASVPVFRHYLSRVSDIVAVAGPDALDARIADAFPARQQFGRGRDVQHHAVIRPKLLPALMHLHKTQRIILLCK